MGQQVPSKIKGNVGQGSVQAPANNGVNSQLNEKAKDKAELPATKQNGQGIFNGDEI